MARAARSDPLVERVDQLADVYGEVLLGLYDELTDQRERTEAVASRADAMLVEARRLMDDMGSAAAQARAIDQEASRIAPMVQAPLAPAPPGMVAAPDPQAEARTREALARLGVLESMAATLEQSVRERTDDAVARCEALTRGLDTQLRANVQESVNGVRAEVQQTVVDLRQHVRELLDAVTREAHETARRATVAPGGEAIVAAPPIDTAAIVDEVRRQASAAIADEVRQQTTTTVADQVGRAAAAITEQVRQQAVAGVAEQIRQQTQATVGEELRQQAAAAVAQQVREQTQAVAAQQAQQVRELTQAVVGQQVQEQAQAAVAQQVREQTQAAVAQQVREQAQTAVSEQVRQQAAAAVAIEMREQSGAVLEDLRRQAASFTPPPAPLMPAGPLPEGTDQMWAQLRAEIEHRTGNFAAAEQRATELANRLNIMITEGRTSLREAQSDRDAAAFALRESRAELEVAKRALDVSDLSFTLDRLRRAELLLYGTAALAVLAIGLWLWTLLS
jgi:hypothetical protein